jgi:sialic acid synthase SpsE
MKPLLIAELGVNHRGSVHEAIRMAQAAVESGADAIKLQLFDPHELTAYRRGGEDMLKTLKAGHLSLPDLVRVKAAVEVPVFASVFAPHDLRRYKDAGFKWLKLSVEMAKLRAMWDEALRVGFERTFASFGPRGRTQIPANWATQWVGILYCPPGYPIASNGALGLSHLAHVTPDAQHFPKGLSLHPADHINTFNATAMAYGYGARIFEFHFCLDDQGTVPEKAWSLDEADFLTMRYLLDELVEADGE